MAEFLAGILLAIFPNVCAEGSLVQFISSFSNSQIFIRSIVVCYLLQITNIFKCFLSASHCLKPCMNIITLNITTNQMSAVLLL